MDTASIRQLIAGNKFFSGLDDAAIDFLTANASPRQLAEGQMLFHQGEPADNFYLMREGHLSLEIPAIEGPALELQDIGPGQIVGWSWLIPPGQWQFQARARTAIDCLQFDGKAVLAHCEAEPAFGFDIARRFSGLMSERLHFARQKMMQAWKPLGFA